jgi:hypothetical protein
VVDLLECRYSIHAPRDLQHHVDDDAAPFSDRDLLQLWLIACWRASCSPGSVCVDACS